MSSPWSTSVVEADGRRRPIAVTLQGRREETDEVMDASLAAALTPYLPKRLQLGKTWRLLFSSDQHGVSLGTLYHKLDAGAEQSNGKRHSGAGGPTTAAEGWLRGASQTTRTALMGVEVQHVGGGVGMGEAGLVLAIKDDEEHIFGAYLNERLRPQPHYYGNGECFLWKASDDGKQLKTFGWTGRNEYMMLTEQHYLSIGGGEGRYGLWLDGALEHGVSSCCPAFDNDVLCDGQIDQADRGERRFECITLEVWACGVD